MHTAVNEILSRCGTETSVLPPTALYNEGWLLRLVLDWLDRHRELEHPLSFMPGSAGTPKRCCILVDGDGAGA